MIIYNRPETSEKVIQAISTYKPERLFVIADGPKSVEDARNCAKTRELIDNIDCKCEISRNFVETNLGCGIRVSTGISWAFQYCDLAIILEDDCVPDPSFFPYCEELLERYKDDTRIGMIGGTNFIADKLSDKKTSYFFSNYTMIWGWATWKRAWEKLDYQLSHWPEIENKAEWLLEKTFDENIANRWFQNFNNLYEKNNFSDIWDYQWTFSLWFQNMLSIIPSRNLVKNIGFGDDATHTKKDNLRLSNVAATEMTFPLVHPEEVHRDTKLDIVLGKRLYTIKKKNILARIILSTKRKVARKSSRFFKTVKN